MVLFKQDEPVDAVIAWVDGADPQHSARRVAFQKLAARERLQLDSNATAAERFEQSDEIRYCVRSLRNHAPWLRDIILVTDGQFPSCFDRSDAARNGIRVVDHAEIFDDRSGALPTFNSLAIETQLWRIPGLAERFIYLNDDMLLTATADPSDFFTDAGVVLRGRWSPPAERLPRQMHPRVQINAAHMMGFTADYFFHAHIPYPMRVSVWRALHERFGGEMRRNASHRFRSLEQFWPIALHAHHVIESGSARTIDNDMAYIRSGMVESATDKKLRAYLRRMADHKTIGACINNLQALEKRVTEARDYLDRAAGPRLAFETDADAAAPHVLKRCAVG